VPPRTEARPETGTAELPEGWAETRLGEICHHPQYGWTTSAKFGLKGLKLVRTSDISSGTIDWASVPVCETPPPESSRKYDLSPGDILVSRAGSVGLSYLIRDCPRSVFASYLIRLRPLDPIPAEFIHLFLQSPAYWESIVEHTAGIAIPNINASKLSNLLVGLPPLAEQRRIAAKVKELFTRVNAARKRLARLPTILKRFRQSVLAAACSGRLTADWRESHVGIEPASNLLARVRAERRAYSAAQPKSATQDEMAFEPPSTWCWASMDELLAGIDAGKNFRCIERPPHKNEVGVVKVSAVTWGTFDENESKTCPDSRLVNPRYFIKQGDFLFSRANTIELVGACVIATQPTRKLMLSDKILRLRLLGDSDRWVLYWLRSSGGRDQIESLATGNQQSMRNIGQDRIRSIAIPLPPTEEQHEIVRRVEAMFKLADAIEKRIQAATARVAKLTQSILAKAFRGELVPQDPNDEPAPILLERIRADQAKEPKSKPERRSRGTGAPIAPREKAAMTKSRNDDDVKDKPYLADLLRQSDDSTSIEDLFKRAELPLADFYKQLAWEVETGHIRDGAKLRAA
jgi:type I restriction enzyme, S subunit